MAATGTPTPNIGLRRPQGTDPASVDDINYNSNLIDTKLGAVGNTSVQEQINSLNSNVTPVSVATGIDGILAEKMGKLVILEIAPADSITSDKRSWVTVGVLPGTLKPRHRTPFVCYDNNSTKDTNVPLQMNITTGGIIQVFFWENVSTSVKPYGTIAYFTA